ncbi:MAG TPA: aldo/keto reductase [Microlunatus sp.]|nr:aldo/keto reductase [Microlunatus sp.]
MEQRPFGSTGLTVSALGLGAGQVGDDAVSEDAAATLLHGALDAGVTLIDTARGYGLSEERIGRHLAGRRDEFVLSSKGGYDVPGAENWTPAAVTAGIDRALRLTRSERIEIFHLHSCPLEVLRRGDLQDALEAAAAAGKIGVAAYSGDNEHLAFAAASGRFGSIETSVNIVDQWNLHHVVGGQPDLGVIAKRPIANAPWRFSERPVGDYAELYWDRLRALDLDPDGFDWDELALRFTAYASGVHSAITGTARLDHLKRNVEIVDRGPLPAELLSRIEDAWSRQGTDWPSST